MLQSPHPPSQLSFHYFEIESLTNTTDLEPIRKILAGLLVAEESAPNGSQRLEQFLDRCLSITSAGFLFESPSG